MKKVLVQFDGSNFYNKVKTLLPNTHLTSFHYSDFVTSIAKINPNNIIYYVGEIRKHRGDKKSESLYSNQQSLFLNLRKQRIIIKLGYLLFGSLGSVAGLYKLSYAAHISKTQGMVKE